MRHWNERKWTNVISGSSCCPSWGFAARNERIKITSGAACENTTELYGSVCVRACGCLSFCESVKSLYVCKPVPMYVCMYLFVPKCVCMSVRKCVFVRVCLYMYACVSACARIHRQNNAACVGESYGRQRVQRPSVSTSLRPRRPIAALSGPPSPSRVFDPAPRYMATAREPLVARRVIDSASAESARLVGGAKLWRPVTSRHAGVRTVAVGQ